MEKLHVINLTYNKDDYLANNIRMFRGNFLEHAILHDIFLIF